MFLKWASSRCSLSVHPQMFTHCALLRCSPSVHPKMFTQCAFLRCSLNSAFVYFTNTNNFRHDFYTFSFWDPCFYFYYKFVLTFVTFLYLSQLFSNIHFVWKYNLWQIENCCPKITNYPKPLTFCIFRKHINIKYRFLCVFMKNFNEINIFM